MTNTQIQLNSQLSQSKLNQLICEQGRRNTIVELLPIFLFCCSEDKAKVCKNCCRRTIEFLFTQVSIFLLCNKRPSISNTSKRYRRCLPRHVLDAASFSIFDVVSSAAWHYIITSVEWLERRLAHFKLYLNLTEFTSIKHKVNMAKWLCKQL